jgi:uncharacterized membrane protein
MGDEMKANRMALVFYLVFALNITLALGSLAVLPDKVASHYGADGAPDAWMTKEAHAVIMVALDVGLLLLIAGTPLLVMKLPRGLVNVPNKDYWLKDENRPALKGMFKGWMAEFGTALFLFFLCGGMLAVQANLSDPVRMNQGPFIGCLVAFSVYVVIWIIRFYRAFRIPE